MDLSGRLKKSREWLGKNQKEMAMVLGVGYRSWQGYEDGSNIPGGSVLHGLAKLGININWLLTDEGQMRLDEVAAPCLNQDHPKIDNEEFALVPKYEVSADCGSGRTINSEQIVDFLAFKKKWLSELGLPRNKLALVTAKGDSMEPTIRDGALMLVDLRKSENLGEGIYIVRLGGDLVAKRIQLGIDGGVFVRSDNKNYPDMPVEPDKVHLLEIFGRVVWAGQRF